MQNERPLAYLSTYIAAARARGRPTRLVLRNSDRVGLIHLYFHHGRLVLVEGHRGAGMASLADLATWQNGTIWQDDLDTAPVVGEPDLQIEAALAEALHQLETRRIISRSSSPQSDPQAASRPSAPRLPAARPNASHGSPGVNISSVPGLPPLPERAVSEAVTQRTPVVPSLETSQYISDAQWQFLTQFVHQVVTRAGQEVASGVAVGMLMQAVSRLGPSSPFIAGLEVDEHGWLHPRQEGLIERFSPPEVARALTALIGDYESRCALVIGGAHAHTVIVEAAAPVRGPLASLGLNIVA